METPNKNYCIILAGGIGRRLWPVSKKELPKQFIDFFGTGRTLLQQTYDRFAKFIPIDQIYISTFEDYVSLVHKQLPEVPTENILPEPVQLNTAPAAIWGTWHVVLKNEDANVIVSPADQIIQDTERFEKQIMRGLEYIDTHNELLAMGVKPSHPNTAYGYIQMGDEVGKQLYRVQSFSEKPATNYANMFMQSGEFLWNTGIFLWKGSVMGTLLAHLSNKPDRPVKELALNNITIAEEVDYARSCIPEGLPKSVDLLVLEHSDNVVVQECDFGWADIGCWTELHDVSRTDADGNAVSGGAKVLFSATQKCMVRLPNNMKAIISGLDGFLIAQQGDTLMICPNKDPDAIRRLINEGIFF